MIRNLYGLIEQAKYNAALKYPFRRICNPPSANSGFEIRKITTRGLQIPSNVYNSKAPALRKQNSKNESAT